MPVSPRKLVLAAVLAAGLLAPSLARGQTALAEPEPVTLAGLSGSLTALSERVSPAVVQIYVSRYAPSLGAAAAGLELFSRQRGSGSGVIVDPDGYIVTNAHVVQGAERIKVQLAASPSALAGRRSILTPRGPLLEAEVVGFDEETDLAVIKVERTGLSHLPFGDSDLLGPGQVVLAFGSPLGLRTSVTMGVVSGLARQLEPDDPMIYVQTDAAINPGNSGGPLVNAEGEVVGINTSIISRSGGDEGIGLAAPSNIVAHVYREIRAGGRVRRGSIGISAQTVTPALAQVFGLPPEAGVIVGDVSPRGPAETAGLRVGDVILSLGEKVMENARQFDVNLYQHAPGETVTLRVLRDQATRTIRAQVEERPEERFRFSGLVTLEENLVAELGVLVLDLEPSVRRMLPGVRSEGGVLVAARAAGGVPWQASLEPGDIIRRVNRTEVSDLAVLRRLVSGFEPDTPVVLQIERRKAFRFVSLFTE